MIGLRDERRSNELQKSKVVCSVLTSRCWFLSIFRLRRAWMTFDTRHLFTSSSFIAWKWKLQLKSFLKFMKRTSERSSELDKPRKTDPCGCQNAINYRQHIVRQSTTGNFNNFTNARFWDLKSHQDSLNSTNSTVHYKTLSLSQNSNPQSGHSYITIIINFIRFV